MKPSNVVLTAALALTCVSRLLAEAPAQGGREAPGELGFLKTGKDYLIRFSNDIDLFMSTKSGISETSYTTEDGETRPGRPATWRVTLRVEFFRVVRLGGGSWALLEHPEKDDDIAHWNGKRRAMATLGSEVARELEATPEGRERLEKLREAAAREIATTRTWVNLGHAVAIADVPTQIPELKLTVRSVEVGDNKPNQ
jgi:hypothetical protein